VNNDLFLLLVGYAIAMTMAFMIWASRRSVAPPATVVLQNGAEVGDGGCLVPLVLLAVVMMVVVVLFGS